jgi:hypothetical protein
MRAANALVLCVGILFAAPTGAQQMQDVAPAKGSVAAVAKARDQLNIVSTTEVSEVADLLADFRALYPRIETVYSKINSNDICNRIVEPASSSEAPGDVIWSSAMDLQVKLVNDGYAQPYVSKEITHLDRCRRHTGIRCPFSHAGITHGPRHYWRKSCPIPTPRCTIQKNSRIGRSSETSPGCSFPWLCI